VSLSLQIKEMKKILNEDFTLSLPRNPFLSTLSYGELSLSTLSLPSSLRYEKFKQQYRYITPMEKK